MVHLTRLNLNSDLERYLKEHQGATLHQRSPAGTASSYHRPPWRVRDRLSDRDMLRLVMAFRTGIATRELAQHYDIDLRSVRKLLREADVKKRLRYDTQA